MPAADRTRPLLRAVSRARADGRLVVVPAGAAGDRLDTFLQRHAAQPPRSRSEWQRLIEAEAVWLNGVACTRPGQRVAADDRVLIADSQPALDLPPEQDVPFQVVFQDAAMLVVDKPAGLVVHPAPGSPSGTLVNGLLARFPELGRAEGGLRPGIVHRLDKDTSGLMVVGRTLAATAHLQRQMQSRSTEKRYLLLVHRNIGEDEGLIDRPIARDPRHRQRMAVRPEGRGAQTHFWVREHFGDWTLVEALLLTGRTHQLRVHFASIGHPIAGDATYGGAQGPPGLARQFLHSHLLRVRSPHDELERTFRADLPAELSSVLEVLRRRGNRTR